MAAVVVAAEAAVVERHSPRDGLPVLVKVRSQLATAVVALAAVAVEVAAAVVEPAQPIHSLNSRAALKRLRSCFARAAHQHSRDVVAAPEKSVSGCRR